jgi:hypothetical protein
MNEQLLIGNTLEETAYHEAGHIVVASALGLALRPQGIEIYETPECLTDGFACYWEDYEAEDVLAALRAGEMAQVRQFPESCVLGSIPDGQHLAQAIRICFGQERFREFRDRIDARTCELLDSRWPTVVAVAEAVVQSDWIPVEGHQQFTRKKHVDGHALVNVLKECGISAHVRSDESQDNGG